jgi:hypothetical protein
MGKPLELHRRLRAALSLRGSIARVARASLGEQAAWDQLVERYGAMVWAVARRHGLGLEDAADVSQVTWLLTSTSACYRSLTGWDSSLFTTATREALRMRRLRGGGVPSPPARPGATRGQGSAAECLPDVPDDPASAGTGRMPRASPVDGAPARRRLLTPSATAAVHPPGPRGVWSSARGAESGGAGEVADVGTAGASPANSKAFSYRCAGLLLPTVLRR